MNKLSGSVSFFPSNVYFSLYNGTDKSFIKMFVPVRMCLQPVTLLGTNTRAIIGLVFLGNICLTLNSDITLS